MKKQIFANIVTIAVISLLSCATAEGGSVLSLQGAIEQSAERMVRDFPHGTRVAVVAFESESDNLSDFIMEELAVTLGRLEIEVADRQNLEFVFQEQRFQMSGYVSDETFQSIGQMLGAELVITGRLWDIGVLRRFIITATHMETVLRTSPPSLDVRNDRAMRNMIAALNRQATTARVDRHGISDHAVPRTAGAYLDRGLLFFQRGDDDIAILDFTEAIRLNPSFAIAYNWRGRVHQEMWNHELAIADFDQAIRLNPNFSVAYSNRGIVHLRRWELDLAIADFNQVIRLSPDNSIAYSNRGIAHSRRGEFERAIADHTQAIRLDPDNAIAHHNRGAVQYRDRGF